MFQFFLNLESNKIVAKIDFFLMNKRNVFTALLTPVVLKLKLEAASDVFIHKITYIFREAHRRKGDETLRLL